MGNNVNHNMEKLRELTGNLPYLPQIVEFKDNSLVLYKSKAGECRGRGLLNIPECAVQEFRMNKGCELLKHRHDVKEFLVVYSGKLIIKIDSLEEEKVLGVSDSFYLNPEIPHTVYAIEDTRGIGITIPRSKGYPDVA